MTFEQLMYIAREVVQDIAMTEESAGTIDTKRRTSIAVTPEAYRAMVLAADKGILAPSTREREEFAGYPVRIITCGGRQRPGIFVMREIEIPFEINEEEAEDERHS